MAAGKFGGSTLKLKSKLEHRTWAQLKGRGWKYESERIPYLFPIHLGICGDCKSKDVSKRRTYIPDFTKGTRHIEAKGKLDAQARVKLLAIKSSNPELDLRLVFQTDNWTTKKHTQRYTDWATKHGFPCCVREIPKSWLA